ncbi:MAG: hypothetical protein D3910_13350, partial [Candidatus Electrothrix sp. ATG2]|nr:hypothetical protein [Candidatus Electrothrix sp. ATG2]
MQKTKKALFSEEKRALNQQSKNLFKQRRSGQRLVQGLSHLGGDHLVNMLRCPDRIFAHGLAGIAEAHTDL